MITTPEKRTRHDEVFGERGVGVFGRDRGLFMEQDCSRCHSLRDESFSLGDAKSCQRSEEADDDDVTMRSVERRASHCAVLKARKELLPCTCNMLCTLYQASLSPCRNGPETSHPKRGKVFPLCCDACCLSVTSQTIYSRQHSSVEGTGVPKTVPVPLSSPQGASQP